MEILMNLSPLFTAIIAFTAFVSFLLVGMNSILDAKITPIKENQVRIEKQMEKRMDGIEERMDGMEKQMEKRMDRMESKLDQLLSDKRHPASVK